MSKVILPILMLLSINKLQINLVINEYYCFPCIQQLTKELKRKDYKKFPKIYFLINIHDSPLKYAFESKGESIITFENGKWSSAPNDRIENIVFDNLNSPSPFVILVKNEKTLLLNYNSIFINDGVSEHFLVTIKEFAKSS